MWPDTTCRWDDFFRNYYAHENQSGWRTPPPLTTLVSSITNPIIRRHHHHQHQLYSDLSNTTIEIINSFKQFLLPVAIFSTILFCVLHRYFGANSSPIDVEYDDFVNAECRRRSNVIVDKSSVTGGESTEAVDDDNAFVGWSSYPTISKLSRNRSLRLGGGGIDAAGKLSKIPIRKSMSVGPIFLCHPSSAAVTVCVCVKNSINVEQI